MLKEMSTHAEGACQEIQTRIATSEVVGSDEICCRVNSRKHWFHVWQNKFTTFIVSLKSRGHAVIEEYFPGRFLHYVSDCWASQIEDKGRSPSAMPGAFIAGIAEFRKSLKNAWCIRKKELFYRAIALKKGLTVEDYQKSAKGRVTPCCVT